MSDMEKALKWLVRQIDNDNGEFDDLILEAASRYNVNPDALENAYDEFMDFEG